MKKIIITEKIKQKVNNKIRNRALLKVKSQLAEKHLTIEEFSEEELEILLAEQETQIKNKLKLTGLGLMLIALGLRPF